MDRMGWKGWGGKDEVEVVDRMGWKGWDGGSG